MPSTTRAALTPPRRRDRPRSRADRRAPRPACPRSAACPRPSPGPAAHRRITRSMLCSMIRKVMPRRFSSAIFRHDQLEQRRVDAGPRLVEQDQRGPAHSTRASSSSLRCPPDSIRAGCRGQLVETDEVEPMHGAVAMAALLGLDPARPQPAAQKRSPACPSGASITFSSTVICGERPGNLERAAEPQAADQVRPQPVDAPALEATDCRRSGGRLRPPG